jgi:hypothetical protein
MMHPTPIVGYLVVNRLQVLGARLVAEESIGLITLDMLCGWWLSVIGGIAAASWVLVEQLSGTLHVLAHASVEILGRLLFPVATHCV